jgi:hypothetical protein
MSEAALACSAGGGLAGLDMAKRRKMWMTMLQAQAAPESRADWRPKSGQGVMEKKCCNFEDDDVIHSRRETK